MKKLVVALSAVLLSFASIPLNVSAANAAGSAPDTPSSIGVRAGDTRMFVGVYAATTGTPATTITVTATPGPFTCTITLPATDCELTGLTNGTSYSVSAVANNNNGSSAALSYSWTAMPSSGIALLGSQKDCSIAPWVVWPCYSGTAATTMTVYGDNLQTCTSLVAFGGGYSTPIPVTPALDGKSITFTRPNDGSAYGWASFNCGLTQNSFMMGAVYPVAQYSSFTPSWSSYSGPLNGGEVVTLTTPYPTFVDVSAVSLGGVTATYQVITNTVMKITIPAGLSVGYKDLVVTNMAGVGTQGGVYNYTAPVGNPPGTPGKPSATAGNGQATVSIVAPSSGGTPTSYTVTASPGGATCTVTSPATSCDVTGLTNDTSYTFTATATNNDGTSGPSDPSDAVTPSSTPVVPGAPGTPTATAGDGKATVSVTPPTSGGAPNFYTITAYPGGASCTAVAPATSCTVRGLTNGTPYVFTATASNDAGTSDPSSSSNTVTPVAAPKAPSIPKKPTVIAGDSSVTVSTSGSVPTPSFYEVTSNPGGFTCRIVAPATSCLIDGLTNGTQYSFTARAFGIGGTSMESEPSDLATPNAAPSVPLAPTVDPGNGKATVTVKPAVGGSSASSYTVTASPGGFTCTVVVPAISCDVQGLTNGTEYSFNVVARNSAGASGASPASKGTPFAAAETTKPSKPGISSVTGGKQSITVEVSPSNAGGAPATYIATAQPGGATCTIVTPATSCVITGLKSGASYKVTVVASNAAGISEPSELASATTEASAVPGDGNGNGMVDTRSFTGFEGGSAVLTSDIKAKLNKLVAVLDGASSIVCTGYTSGPTVAAGDRALAKARALAVCNYLRSRVASITSYQIEFKTTTVLGAGARKVVVTF